MKQNALKFDYNYIKLHEQKTAKLLDVEVVNRNSLDKSMIDLDTAYVNQVPIPNESKTLSKIEHSTLPKGTLLLLTFKGDKKIPFTTLRRHNAKRWDDYLFKVYQEFDIIVK